MTDYKVVAECAHVTVDGGIRLIYKGAPVPPGQDPKRLKHLLDSKLIAPAGEVTVAPNAAVINPEAGGTTPAVAGSSGPDAEVEQKRAAARAKLPADGSAPDGRASQETWVEYAVTKGISREEAEKASKDDLKQALQK